jgi:hypothetical protein
MNEVFLCLGLIVGAVITGMFYKISYYKKQAENAEELLSEKLEKNLEMPPVQQIIQRIVQKESVEKIQQVQPVPLDLPKHVPIPDLRVEKKEPYKGNLGSVFTPEAIGEHGPIPGMPDLLEEKKKAYNFKPARLYEVPAKSIRAKERVSDPDEVRARYNFNRKNSQLGICLNIGKNVMEQCGWKSNTFIHSDIVGRRIYIWASGYKSKGCLKLKNGNDYAQYQPTLPRDLQYFDFTTYRKLQYSVEHCPKRGTMLVIDVQTGQVGHLPTDMQLKAKEKLEAMAQGV